jgi:hypothetical protein
LNLCQLFGNGIVVNRQPPQTAERPRRFVRFVLLDQEPRRFGQDQQPSEEDQRPGQLNGDGDAV